jgi:serine-type D-Ala-D-Ala carboxypeptidase (penicillin-binding protein 5/6)
VTTLIRPLVAAVAAALLVGAPTAAAAEPPPNTSGAAAIVIDARTGDRLYGKDPREERPIASATKLMTALLTLERAKLDDVFTAAPYTASPVESKIGLMPGERMTVEDLLTALILESANDAAVTLAKGVAGSPAAFVREMNRRAVALGLRDTSYANPVGFDDPNNYSSARDLAELARRLLANPEFARITDLPMATLHSGARNRTIENRNVLVQRYPFVSGVKTGHTMGAGYVLVGAGAAGGARVITVTLGAPSESARDADTLALLRWGLEQFHRVRVLRPGKALEQIDVNYRDEDAEVGAAEPVTLVLRRGERVDTVLDAPGELDGPLAKGERVGSIAVEREGKTVRRVPLVTLSDVEGASFVRKVARTLGTLLIVAILLGIFFAVIFAVRRRRGIA